VTTRDAGSTRQALLQAARLRFARNGYSSTTVREIAADAGVNVALISRYFVSKEGLFEACLTEAAEKLARPEGESTMERIIETMVRHATAEASGDRSLQLMLLLRTSGDERADLIRRTTLESFARSLAAAAGWRADDPATDHLILRAQIGLSMSLGIVLLRSSTGLEPLSSATEADLMAPIADVFASLLPGAPA
jgi:AcrR family transcriptional regulator